jgi:hypothetical protein
MHTNHRIASERKGKERKSAVKLIHLIVCASSSKTMLTKSNSNSNSTTINQSRTRTEQGEEIITIMGRLHSNITTGLANLLLPRISSASFFQKEYSMMCHITRKTNRLICIYPNILCYIILYSIVTS